MHHALPPRLRRVWRPLIALLAVFVLPIAAAAGTMAYRGGPTYWRDWDRSVTSVLPPAAEQPQARVLVMTGRTRGWKGAVALHSWIAFKPENSDENGGAWQRYDVSGWGGTPVRRDWWPPDLWFGERGVVVLDLRGEPAARLIPRIEAAIRDYRWANAGDYRMWPGPNSNTFIAAVLRAIPEAGVTLPPDAIGRDYRPLPYAGMTDSGTGMEANLWGVLGVKAGWVEGIEVNVGGFVAGLDLRRPGVKLPGLGRIGFDRLTAAAQTLAD